MNLQQKHHIQLEREALSIAYARHADFSEYDEFAEFEESLGKKPIDFDAPAGVGHYIDEFTLI
jgi:hypothetical protein